MRVMPRKLRLEFPGACYHVLNRDNCRADLFQSEEPGGLADTPAGRRSYADCLAWQAAEGPAPI